MVIEQKIKAKSRDLQKLHEYKQYLREHPKLMFLFVELTDCCNLQCLHCGSSCLQEGTMIDTEMLLATLEEVAEDLDPGKVMICLTGGEPLLHPDFFRIVGKIDELGFPWGITTNGTLIDGPTTARLKEYHMGSVTVSLDGLEGSHDHLRQRPGAWAMAKTAVEHLNRIGINVQITTVIHSQNYDELEEIYRMVCDMDVYSWRVINIEPIGRSLEHQDLSLNSDQMKGLLDFIREKRFDRDTPMDVRFGCSHYLSFEYEHEVRDNYFLCGAGIYVGSILCNGDIFSCLDIERRPELIQGNIAHDRFSEVWFDRFQAFRADRTELNAECKKCPEKNFCRADSLHTWDFDENRPAFCILRDVDPDTIVPGTLF